MRFRGVCYGFGSSHDARILSNSSLKEKIFAINDPSSYILGDKAFQGIGNIQITETTRAIPRDESTSVNLRKQRIVVENAFGLFKNKFKRFDVRSYQGEKIKNIKILLSCIWLHNFIIENKE